MLSGRSGPCLLKDLAAKKETLSGPGSLNTDLEHKHTGMKTGAVMKTVALMKDRL